VNSAQNTFDKRPKDDFKETVNHSITVGQLSEIEKGDNHDSESKENSEIERKYFKQSNQDQINSENMSNVIYLNKISGTCLKVDVEINGSKCKLLVDTGSPVCIISETLFSGLNDKKGLLKHTNTTIHTADGSVLTVKGKIGVQLKIGPLCLDQEIIVAKLDDISGILGMNFLEKNDVEIQIGKRVLKIKGHKIKVNKDSSSMCAKVRLSDKTNIPANSEMMVESYIEGNLDSVIGLIESTKYVQSKGLLMAKALVSTTNDNKCSLFLLNLNQKTVKINQNTVIGMFNCVDRVEEECVQEANDDDHNDDTVLPEYLNHLVDNVSEKLTDFEKDQLIELIKEFSCVFAQPNKPLGQTDLVTHKIDTGHHKPIKLPPRRVPLAKKEAVDREIDKLLKDKLIEPSSSPWSAPICLVTKKDGTPRFCVDFRKLNAITKKDAYPLPKPDDTFEALTGSRWYHVVDMQTGYWQLKIDSQDQHKTAFATYRGLFEFRVMPMGLSNSAASFERLIETVLGNLNWKKCLCYLDDIIIFGQNFEEALQNLREVFSET